MRQGGQGRPLRRGEWMHKGTEAKMGEGRIHREGTAGAKVLRQDYASERQCSWGTRRKGEEMDLMYGYGGGCQNGHSIPACTCVFSAVTKLCPRSWDPRGRYSDSLGQSWKPFRQRR